MRDDKLSDEMACREKKQQVFLLLAVDIRGIFEKSSFNFSKLQEIRLRAGKPLLVLYDGEEYVVGQDGRAGKMPERSFIVSTSHIRESMEYISNYSMYAFEEEMRQGYVTAPGGHRVGLSGKAIWEKGSVKNMRYISFLNIRIAHEVKGCADKVMSFLYRGEGVYHTLVISPPGCGKTTLLRDIIRQVSNGYGKQKGMTIGVVDERSEIGACYRGKPQNDLGCRTDVLDGCPKSIGMMMLVRSMAPKVIAVDEAGSAEDVSAMKYVMNCGVYLFATVHGESIEEIKKKGALGNMVKEHAFGRYVVLKTGEKGRMLDIFDETETRIG